jgi:hypothetical protein
MENIAIRLEEKNGVVRINEPVGLGVPLPKGAVRQAHELAVTDGLESISAQLEPLARWPDGSIRWVHVSFLANLNSGQEKDFLLTRLDASLLSSSELAIEKTADGLTIFTSVGRVDISAGSLAWFVTQQSKISTSSSVNLSDASGLPCTVKAEDSWEITHQGPVFVAVSLKGQWLKHNSERLARFDCELKVFLETGLILVELITHNPKRARHSGGLWDLGDPGSVHFSELAIETTVPAKSFVRVAPQATDQASEVAQLTEFNLYQDSSGGENWQSNNHINGSGKISTQFCGYRLSAQSDVVLEGKRANPLISIDHQGVNLDVAVPGFWQNFPTSLRKQKNSLTVGLFPKEAKNTYELQGGERKTLRLLMMHGSGSSVAATAYTPLVPVLFAKCYEQAAAFPWFKANSQHDDLDRLIDNGVNGSSNYYVKREVIDEFGWRNFGEIVADHESLYQGDGHPPLISHYNNQYDPIYGFARQFALTGDKRWFQLMDDLARHVTDIDIYHTVEDRAEYNNGLFWHTDHYLDAKTATHRTFSRNNNVSSTPGQTGGGPAEEHCYSTGLLYHYFLTGNRQSREAVLDLAKWMTALHEGQGGLLEQILALKKTEIRILKKMICGAHVSTHRYPFNRGTGNYINTLLDASIIDSGAPWLKQAEAIIRSTIHPTDDIAKRNLLIVETGWSYLVLLASIFRYLYIKRELNEKDEQYEFAKASLLHYTSWMLENERSFMVDKSQLEFANDTWIAQDIRKAMLMFQASELDYEKSAQYHKTGRIWLEDITRTLQNSQEIHLSRILVILMQSYGPQTLTKSEMQRDNRITNPDRHWAPPIMTWRELIARICRRIAHGLLTFRPSREMTWLNKRLDRS